MSEKRDAKFFFTSAVVAQIHVCGAITNLKAQRFEKVLKLKVIMVDNAGKNACNDRPVMMILLASNSQLINWSDSS